MTQGDQASESMPRSRWIWGFVFLFLAHAALVFWLGDRSRPRPFGASPEPFIYIAGDERAQREVIGRMRVLDPTVFALPTAIGFSGKAWLNFTRQAESASRWSEPAEPLPMRANDVGDTLSAFVITNRPSDRPLLDNLRTFSPTELDLPSDPIATRSSFKIRGPLAARKLIAMAALPSVPQADLLTNSIIDILVNGDGIVESTLLVGECGIKSLDEKALAAVGMLRFEPLSVPGREREVSPPVRGRVVLTWHVSASVTNATGGNGL